jgi:hypothetical protein
MDRKTPFGDCKYGELCTQHRRTAKTPDDLQHCSQWVHPCPYLRMGCDLYAKGDAKHKALLLSHMCPHGGSCAVAPVDAGHARMYDHPAAPAAVPSSSSSTISDHKTGTAQKAAAAAEPS